MDQIRLYIEKECIKNWNIYISYLQNDENKKDLESIVTFMFEDILPENLLKGEKSLLQSMSKSEKIQILEHPESFLSKYIQDVFRREKNVNNLVVRSIVRSFQGFKKELEEKKKECNAHMKSMIQFFVELKKSERILLTNKKLELHFKEKRVLITKLLNPYELGEIFGRYLLAQMFTLPSNTSEFYKGIYQYIQNKDYEKWHPLLKYGIFLFVVIEQLFKRDRTEFSSLFNIKLMKKFLDELCILKYGKEQSEQKGKKGDKGKKGKEHKDKRDDQRREQGRDRGRGYQRGGKSKEEEYMLRMKYLKNYGKKLKEKKKGEKKKYEERNKFINIYNKILKDTKVYNVYPGQNKSSDTLYGIFLENSDLKSRIRDYYDQLLFKDPSKGYCQPPNEKDVQICDFKKKLPIIYAESNPDAYFSIEQDLFADKTGPKKEYLTRGTRKEDRDQILDTLQEKLTMYKAYYVYDDTHFNYFMKDLKIFQMQLIYLIYALYYKKFQLYKLFGNIVDSIIEESEDEENNQKNELNMNKNQNNRNGSGSRSNKKDIISMILEKKYDHLNSLQKSKMDLIYEKLKKIVEMKNDIIKKEFGTPEYDNKIGKVDKYIQLLRIEAQKILE